MIYDSVCVCFLRDIWCNSVGFHLLRLAVYRTPYPYYRTTPLQGLEPELNHVTPRPPSWATPLGTSWGSTSSETTVDTQEDMEEEGEGEKETNQTSADLWLTLTQTCDLRALEWLCSRNPSHLPVWLPSGWPCPVRYITQHLLLVLEFETWLNLTCPFCPLWISSVLFHLVTLSFSRIFVSGVFLALFASWNIASSLLSTHLAVPIHSTMHLWILYTVRVISTILPSPILPSLPPSHSWEFSELRTDSGLPSHEPQIGPKPKPWGKGGPGHPHRIVPWFKWPI